MVIVKKSSVDILEEIFVLESPEPKKVVFTQFLPNSRLTSTGYKCSRWVFNQLNQFYV